MLTPIAIAATIILRDGADVAAHRTLANGKEFDCVGAIGSGYPAGTCTLIKPNWVLTAGHVVYGMDAKKLRVRFSGKFYEVNRVVFHPDFCFGKKTTARSSFDLVGVDLALIELKEKPDINPAAINHSFEEKGQVGTLVGFGLYGMGLEGSRRPRYGVKSAGTNTIDCVGGIVNGELLPTRIMAADFDSPTNPELSKLGDSKPLPMEAIGSTGDSGGPVFITVKGMQVLAGVLTACTIDRKQDVAKYGLYGCVNAWTRTSLYCEWIDRETH